MKKSVAAVILLVLLLAGCGAENADLARGLALREAILAGKGCSFTAEVTADYGESLHIFSVACEADAAGNLQFTLLAPETVAGITGTVSENGGALTFDGTALAFPLLADNQVTPVSAPWLLVKTLRSGYIAAAGREGELLRLSIDDSYADDALRLEIWADGENRVVHGDILYGGKRILTLEVKDFTIL